MIENKIAQIGIKTNTRADVDDQVGNPGISKNRKIGAIKGKTISQNQDKIKEIFINILFRYFIQFLSKK